MASSKHVIVIGAGVIGLQTAFTLLKTGYTVSIIAEHWPDTSMDDGQYTSAWAGAQWRTHAAPGSEAASWDASTYRYWQSMMKNKPAHARSIHGVAPIKLTEFRAIAPDPSTPWWASLSPSFNHIDSGKLPLGIATGVSMDAFVVYPKEYLEWLLGSVTGFGASTHRIRLPTDGGLPGVIAAAKQICAKDTGLKPLAVVNATGLLAKNICPDDSLSPVRGQTLLVKGESKELKTMIGRKPGEVLAIIPRVGTGTTIVGSTRGPGRWDLEPDEKDTEWLEKEARLMAPELFGTGKLELLKVNVGLRPSRKGGARVETEYVDEDAIIHCYGHDGAGYQNSVGSAEKVLKLLREYEKSLIPSSKL